MSRKTAVTAEVLDASVPIQPADQNAAALHALAVNKALGVTEYSLEAAASRLRGLMANATQALLDIGETLMLVQAHEPEAVYSALLERVGIDTRAAGKMMQAARKFRLGLTAPQQQALSDLSRGKLLELVTLDDEDVQGLADGGTVAGLTLDDVSLMTTTELRKALRAEKARVKEATETNARLLEAKNEKIDSLEAQVDKFTHGGADTEAALKAQREAHAAQAMKEAGLALLGAVQKFNLAVADCLAEDTPTRRALAEGEVNAVFTAIAQISLEFAIPVDFAAIVAGEH